MGTHGSELWSSHIPRPTFPELQVPMFPEIQVPMFLRLQVPTFSRLKVPGISKKVEKVRPLFSAPSALLALLHILSDCLLKFRFWSIVMPEYGLALTFSIWLWFKDIGLSRWDMRHLRFLQRITPPPPPPMEQHILFNSNGLAIWHGFSDITYIKVHYGRKFRQINHRLIISHRLIQVV